MNTPHLLQAIENLDGAMIFTIDEADREEIRYARETIRRLLQKHGVFVGCAEQPTRKET